MNKTRKSIAKRVTVTKKGNLVVRKAGQSKLRAKKSSKNLARKSGNKVLGPEQKKRILAQLQ